ncbi:MAG: DUF3786 domain-containing protein [Firmicutes bacterium]|jgi:hypothetical protein|nr:DUF3786 domain-containing protein [Bacillota bacterium]
MKNQKRGYFNLDVAYKRAAERLSTLEPTLVAERAGIQFNRANATFSLPFLNREYQISFPRGEVLHPDGSAVSLYRAIIVLHYLITADGTPLQGHWVSYRHLPGGDIYIEPFRRRALTPFLNAFAHQPDRFQEAAAALGGRRAALGGENAVISVMPRVPLCFVLWPGDDEIPAAANILFDAQAPSYLPTEDYGHLPAIVCAEMKKIVPSD